MKYITQILVTFFTISLALSQKKSDEDHPYEFGFTIDGEQHRHEKRDEKGIVQGEFGFITADGVYHVTVYATDENGKFKILSMRNLRISAPLDGSPLRGELSPEAEKYRKKAGLSPLPAPAPAPVANVNIPSSFANPSAPVVTDGNKPIFTFSTQPTDKPSCAGCGYVTTKAPPSGPNNGFNFQNPVFSEQDKVQIQPPSSQIPSLLSPQSQSLPSHSGQLHPYGNDAINVGSPVQDLQAPINPPRGSGLYNNLPAYQPTNGVQHTNYPSGGQTYPNQPSVGGGNNYATSGGVSNFGVPGAGNAYGGDTGNGNYQPSVSGANNYATSGGATNFGGPSLPQIPDFGNVNGGGGLDGNYFNQPGQNPTPATLPPISVTDGAIQVGGANPQNIPIKDKFPGMQNGLPAGIEEKDITDLLYKFHYTVGFQGHYEKGLKNGAKIGGYFVNGRDGISRVVTYIADENGYRPKVKFINLGLDSEDTPKPESEKTFGLKSFEFIWYPLT